MKYENPEVIEVEDAEAGDEDGESCEEILNSILPPREWEHNGKLWRQRVSASPATRLDVMNLQEQLDQKLQQRQARETGICQVRTYQSWKRTLTKFEVSQSRTRPLLGLVPD